MTAFLDPLLTTPAWLLLLVVGLIVFAEDALFFGFVLPGETAAVLAGVAASRGHVDVWLVLAVVIAAAILGDSVGYEVGRRFGPRILAMPVLEKRRERVDSARALLARRGGMAVLTSRSIAFLRAVVPALAGVAHMPYGRFLFFNALGGVIWGAAVVLIGYLAGESYATIERTVGRGVAYAVVVVVIVGLVGWHFRKQRRPEQR